jgi:hypothetical protein
LAGINPAHFLIGAHVAKHMSPELRAELLTGAHLSSVDALSAHRSVDSIVRGYDPLSKSVRAAAEWSRQHGAKQAIAKFLPQTLRRSSNVLLATNALLTEALPQYGALGKLALADFRETQGSWVKALAHQKQLAEEFAKGAANPKTMVRYQKAIEETYGNYTHMSPAARKVLSTVAPFWTWMRSAYKFVYLTLPAHHPIQTALLTAAARGTEEERKELGFDKFAERPLPDWLQGGIPTPGGGEIPLSNYNSFGFAGSPIEGAAKALGPQVSGLKNAAEGRNWLGEEIPGSEQGRIPSLLWGIGTSFVPGANLFLHEKSGKKSFGPPPWSQIFPPASPKDAGYIQYQREPKKTITVPDTSAESTGGTDMSSVFGGASNSGVDLSSVFSGGD